MNEMLNVMHGKRNVTFFYEMNRAFETESVNGNVNGNANGNDHDQYGILSETDVVESVNVSEIETTENKERDYGHVLQNICHRDLHSALVSRSDLCCLDRNCLRSVAVS